jgi:5-methylcytosine-specific restriction endonuclease McrA
MAPHKILSWQDGVTMLFNGKAEQLEVHDDVIGVLDAAILRLEFPALVKALRLSPDDLASRRSVTLFAPAVLRVSKPMGHTKRALKFSRENVGTRDGWRCSYCDTTVEPEAMTYDHVVPRKHGGKTVWENVVAACRPCNHRKADRTPEQAGMKLLRQPHKPRSLPMTTLRVPKRGLHALWVPYLQAQA